MALHSLKLKTKMHRKILTAANFLQGGVTSLLNALFFSLEVQKSRSPHIKNFEIMTHLTFSWLVQWPNLLSRPETLGNWTDGRLHVVLSLVFIIMRVVFNLLIPTLRTAKETLPSQHSDWKLNALTLCSENVFLASISQISLIFSRPYWVVRSRLWYDVLSVCRLSVTFCIVAKRYVVEGRRW